MEYLDTWPNILKCATGLLSLQQKYVEQEFAFGNRGSRTPGQNPKLCTLIPPPSKLSFLEMDDVVYLAEP